jgi:hypothetical protein
MRMDGLFAALFVYARVLVINQHLGYQSSGDILAKLIVLSIDRCQRQYAQHRTCMYVYVCTVLSILPLTTVY